MQIRKLGHSCLHIVDGDASILIDPGNFSRGFEDLTGLTGILVTHVHADHLDPAKFAALAAANPQAAIYADPVAADEIGKLGVTATAVQPGQTLDAGTAVTTHGGQHAVIHADVPQFSNIGFLVGGRLFHPGDSLQLPDVKVEILAVPVMAPWMALKEAVDFERAIAPQVSIPIHDALLRDGVTAMYYGRLEQLGPDGLQLVNIDDGVAKEF